MAKKIWFVAGSCRGFGRIWAEAALMRGDLVAASARKVEDLDDLKESFGESVLPLGLDVTNDDKYSHCKLQFSPLSLFSRRWRKQKIITFLVSD